MVKPCFSFLIDCFSRTFNTHVSTPTTYTPLPHLYRIDTLINDSAYNAQTLAIDIKLHNTLSRLKYLLFWSHSQTLKCCFYNKHIPFHHDCIINYNIFYTHLHPKTSIDNQRGNTWKLDGLPNLFGCIVATIKVTIIKYSP
jgi:hypothetical protein